MNHPNPSSSERAVVQGTNGPRAERIPPGSIAWFEHVAAWEGYRREYPGSAARQDARVIHERGGFSYRELARFLGHEPTTWVPRA